MPQEVSRYLNESLRPALLKFGADENFMDRLLQTVKTQMDSALRNWRDEAFRKTITLLVSEEAPFYRPDAPLDVKSFVVLTVRNSPFETLQSDFYERAGLRQPISDEQIRKITAGAIVYFKNYDLTSLSDGEDADGEDVYRTLSKRYPVAWNALNALANSKENSCEFPPLTRADAEEFIANFKTQQTSSAAAVQSVKDGFENSLDPEMLRLLTHNVTNRVPFYVDCFKMISRNPNVVLSVLEHLLVSGLTLITANYLITNGHAEKRKNVIKAAHTAKEIKRHLTNLNGISPLHRKWLAAIRENFSE